MKKMYLLLPLTVVITSALTWLYCRYMFERPVFDENVAQKTMQSSVLGERRDYLVHLPETYNRLPNKAYPVIYVMDGTSEDMHTAASATLLARIGVMPEVIVVGVPNVSGKGRQRDYTPPGMRQDVDLNDRSMGQADRFLAFLRDELIPRIDQDYRTTDARLLAGHSRGGLFVVYALTAEPQLFYAYIANSPALWRDDEEMIKRLQAMISSTPSLRVKLFLSLGSDENEKMKAAFTHATEALSEIEPAGLRWSAQSTFGADHSTNSERATPVALRWVFETDSAASPAVSPVDNQ